MESENEFQDKSIIHKKTGNDEYLHSSLNTSNIDLENNYLENNDNLSQNSYINQKGIFRNILVVSSMFGFIFSLFYLIIN